jgi:hypothetical protein
MPDRLCQVPHNRPRERSLRERDGRKCIYIGDKCQGYVSHTVTASPGLSAAKARARM